MAEIDDFDAAYDSARASDPNPSPGEYIVRAKSVDRAKSERTGALGLRVRFLIEEGPYAGRHLFDTFWLNDGAGPISVENLGMIGFSNLKPSAILAFQEFHRLPRILARVERRQYEGRTYAEIRSYRRAEAAGGSGNGSGGAS